MDENVFNAMFGARVKYYRERKGYTQKELADKIGYTAGATIHRIEKGQQTIPLSKLPDFCSALDVEPFDLIGLSSGDKKVWAIAEKVGSDAKGFRQFIEVYLRLLADKDEEDNK